MADVAERKGVKKKERKNLIRWSRILLTLSEFTLIPFSLSIPLRNSQTP